MATLPRAAAGFAGLQEQIWRGRAGLQQLLSEAGERGEQIASWLGERLRSSRGAVAVLLPGTDGPIALAELQGKPLLRPLRETAAADTAFFGESRRLWLVELASPMRNEQVHDQIQWLQQLVEEATCDCQPHRGPWVWPLHDNSVSVAVLVSNLLLRDRRVPWWRHVLWGLRLAQLPGGSREEVLLRRQYGREVAYVFSWSNVYCQFLWVLAFLLLGTQLCTGASMGDSGSRKALAWNVLQLIALAWAVSLAALGTSEALVMRFGGAGLKRTAVAGAAGSRTAGTSAPRNLRGFDLEALRADKAEAVRLERAMRTRNRLRMPASAEAAEELADLAGMFAFDQELAPESAVRPGAAPAKPHPAELGLPTAQQPPAEPGPPTALQPISPACERWRRAKVRVLLGVLGRVLDSQRNWHYIPTSPEEQRWRWYRAAAVTYLSISVFSAGCMVVLAAFAQLNAWIIYVWGQCMYPEVRARARAQGNACRDPQFVHGFSGWLAEVGSDVALALLFDVLLGEGAKALARALAGTFNFKYWQDYRYCQLLISMLVEVLSKVGMFALIGFVFLPRWLPDRTGPFSVEDDCGRLLDYRICQAVSGAVRVHAVNCDHTLLCIARRLDFEERRVVFEKAVKGPFMVAPFVRMLITVVVPFLSGVIEETVTERAEDAPPPGEEPNESGDLRRSLVQRAEEPTGRRGGLQAVLRCLRAAAGVVSRLMRLIFHSDGDHVGGFDFVLHGWPFGCLRDVAPSTTLPASDEVGRAAGSLSSALDQATRKRFEPEDELLELKMNFLFVTFFAPIMPFGIVATLVARVLEVRFKGTKLLFVRRRHWPDDAEADVLHRTHGHFAQLVVVLASFWHTGLIVVSYNAYLPTWPASRTAALWLLWGFGLAAALFLGAALAPLPARIVAPWVARGLGRLQAALRRQRAEAAARAKAKAEADAAKPAEVELAARPPSGPKPPAAPI